MKYVILIMIMCVGLLDAGEKETISVVEISKFLGEKWKVQRVKDQITIESKFDVYFQPPISTPERRILLPHYENKTEDFESLEKGKYKVTISKVELTWSSYRKLVSKKTKLQLELLDRESRNMKETMELERKYSSVVIPHYNYLGRFLKMEGDNETSHLLHPLKVNGEVGKMHSLLDTFFNGRTEYYPRR